MKNIHFIAFLSILLLGCQKEETTNITGSEFETASLFAQLADASLDNSDQGLYYGVFNTFDTSIKGEIKISLGNNNQYRAEVHLLNGEVLNFHNNSKKTGNYVFSNDRGSFIVSFNNEKQLESQEMIIDEKQGYVRAFKQQSAARIPGAGIVMGTFVDSSDPTFTGNWDMFSISGTTGPIGVLIENICISIGSQVRLDETEFEWEAVTSTCLFPGIEPSPTAYTDGLALVGINQIATFNGNPCAWNFDGFILPGGFSFNPDCTLRPLIDGTWSWNGRSGTFLPMVPTNSSLTE